MRSTVALMFGGRSSEHGISCVTAGGILEQIDRDRFDVIPIGITRTGTMVLADPDSAAWTLRDGKAPEVPGGTEVLLPTQVPGPGQPCELRVIREGRIEHAAWINVFFPVLHGAYGEDGTIQGALDLLDAPYVGSGVLGSALATDKHMTKAVLSAAGIACAPGIVVREPQWRRDPDIVRAQVAKFELPLFVKPARAGSSVGVSKVSDLSDLDAALQLAFAEDPKVLIEQGMPGREVECGVLASADGSEPRTSLPGEVSISDDLDFYDYESKYFGKGTVATTVPAELPEPVMQQVREVAARAFTELQLEGLARVDVFVGPDGSITVNEVNTMPGFTPFSMFPVLWQNMGISYRDLITELLDLALNRRRGLR